MGRPASVKLPCSFIQTSEAVLLPEVFIVTRAGRRFRSIGPSVISQRSGVSLYPCGVCSTVIVPLTALSLKLYARRLRIVSLSAGTVWPCRSRFVELLCIWSCKTTGEALPSRNAEERVGGSNGSFRAAPFGRMTKTGAESIFAIAFLPRGLPR